MQRRGINRAMFRESSSQPVSLSKIEVQRLILVRKITLNPWEASILTLI